MENNLIAIILAISLTGCATPKTIDKTHWVNQLDNKPCEITNKPNNYKIPGWCGGGTELKLSPNTEIGRITDNNGITQGYIYKK